jgi:hypothetical protein
MRFAEHFEERYLVPTADLWFSSFRPAWRKKRGYSFKWVNCRTKGRERQTRRTTALIRKDGERSYRSLIIHRGRPWHLSGMRLYVQVGRFVHAENSTDYSVHRPPGVISEDEP